MSTVTTFRLQVPGRLQGAWLTVEGERVCREDLIALHAILGMYLKDESGWPTEAELREMWRCLKKGCEATVDEDDTVPVFNHPEWKGCPKCGYQCAPINKETDP